MSKCEILAGATDQTIDLFIRDSSSTTGGGLTGLAYNTASLVCYYRKGATGTPAALTLATQTVGGAHSDGGFVAVDGTNCPGQYRLDLSDTIVATAGRVTLYLKGATNMAPCVVEIEVVSVNKFDAVRMGMTALPNAAADGAGGLPISDAGGLDLDARLDAAITSRMASYTQPTGFLAATFPGTVASTTNITSATGIDVTKLGGSTQSLTDLKDFADTGYDPVTHWAKSDIQAIGGNASGVSNLNDFVVSGYDPALHKILLVDTVTNLTNAPTAGDLTATMKTSVNTEVAAALATYDGPTNAEMVARTIAAADYATAAELAKVPKSDGTATWNATALASINAEADTALADYDAPTNAEMVARTLATADYATATDLGTVDTVVDAIKVKTDQFVFTVANQVDANALSGGGGLDAAGVRAAVGLASANLDTQLTAIDDYLDTEVAAIKAKTDLLTTFPANFSSLSIDSTGFVGANVTNSGTAAAGSSSSLTLSASASTTNSYYVRQYVQIVSGTGAGQVRQVAAYTGSTKVVTVNFAWVTNPDNTSVYRIIAAHVPHVADNAGVTRAKDENDASLATAASLNAVDDFLDTEVAAILAAVDTEVAAIKAKTDQLTFTVANQVDSNALSGGGSGLDAAGVRSALGMSSANLDTQLADIPTVSEFEARTIASASYATATALGTTDTAVQTLTTRVGIPAVSVSDDLAAVPAAVRTELTTELGRIDAAVSTRATPAQVATELATYDGPTNAEMVARTLPAASYAEPGDAMTLTTGERTAVANEVEAQIIDDTDSEKVLEAIVNKIAAANPSLEDLTLAAIASAVRTELATELARIDAAITTRLASASYTAPPSASTNASAVRTELTTELGRIDAAITTRATPAQVATELATYDGPTNAEMEARTLPSASYTEAGDEMTLADSEDVYPADIGFTIDDTNSRDEYTVVWFRNGAPVTSGITVPTIQAIKRADGTNLIPSSVMTQIGSSGAYKYDATTTERTTAGEAVVVVVSATINGSTRTWRKVITRDVEVV